MVIEAKLTRLQKLPDRVLGRLDVGGCLWPIHDKETGLIVYCRCGDCLEKI